MAHFAQLDENNCVVQVVVISNDDLLDGNGVEQESIGATVCQNIFGAGTRWVQTSYTGKTRKKYAGVGDKFDPVADVFYSPNAPFPSWVLDANCDWRPPTPMPDDGKPYVWDEDSLTWVGVPTEEPGP
jgi:hypothetical protein